MKEYEEYYLLMKHLFLSFGEIKKMNSFEKEYLVNEIKKK